jgi:hypothetical protein
VSPRTARSTSRDDRWRKPEFDRPQSGLPRHSRLQYGLRQYQEDPSFRGDIVLIEPKETDKHFFQLNALAYWQRIRAAQFGYMSVTESIQDNYDLIKQILESYGITMTRRQVRASVERIREEDIEESADVLTQEVPTRKLSVA